ncbi:MAG: hypothetical protein ACI93R_002989 [Flavobacteriales bacterium]|jgi:hypothetical protein
MQKRNSIDTFRISRGYKTLMQFPQKIIILLLTTGAIAGCGGGGTSENKTEPNNRGGSSTSDNSSNSDDSSPSLSFTDESTDAGLSLSHGFVEAETQTMPMMFSGGVAAGDYDNDGDLDFYIVAGDLGQNHLYQNQSDGTFVEVSAVSGVSTAGPLSTGPAFADVDGDGWLDLFVGSVDGHPVYLFKNDRDGTFSDITSESGLNFQADNTVSVTFGDIDSDGDIDMLAAHWGHPMNMETSREIVWLNETTEAKVSFVDVSTAWGMNDAYIDHINPAASLNNTDTSTTISTTKNAPDSAFVPSLSDIERDGDVDLLLVSDFGSTKILRNDAGTGFTNITPDSIIDQNGMGSTLGDFDNDGDIDWYVTSIHFKENDAEINQSDGFTGNRLYQNDGLGNFLNVGTSLKVADGGWGWGACFADFNNDGLLDIFHVNGWGQNDVDFDQYRNDNSRIFIQSADGSFKDSAFELGFLNPKQGRGLACNDFDRDGDIDIVISNNQDSAKFFRNNLTAGHNYLSIQLRGNDANSQALGAIIEVSDQTGGTYTRELRTNNNFTSMSATEAHFGFGTETRDVEINITWPNGETTARQGISLNQLVVINQDD